MADGFSVEVDTAAFEGAMQRLRKGVREGFIDPQMGTLSVQARLLAERCQAFTPPRNVGQGNAAVMRDLTRIYFPVSESTFKSKSIRRIIRNDDRVAWNKVAMNFGSGHGLRNTQAVGFTPAQHANNRDSRGRGSRGKYGNIGLVSLGPQASAAREYMKKIKARVGWARAGWNIGILRFGGTIKASWMGRHGTQRGSVIDGRTSPDPYIAISNDSGWAKYNGSEGRRIVRNAVDARIRDMQKYFERMMQIAADKARKAA